MTDIAPVTLPTRRPTPFDPPSGLAALRERHPIAPMAYPDGHQGWLVTSHDLVREVLADRRFSSRSELRHHPLPGEAYRNPQPAPPGVFTATDAPAHTRYRHLLTGQFTVRRMRLLTGRVREITAGHLDAMERHGPGVDLVTAYAQPIPALVICELLGVPPDGRAVFQGHMTAMTSVTASQEERYAAYGAMSAAMRDLVAAKRAEPADDLLSGLTASDLTDEELGNIAFTLLGAGLDTTANMIALGVFALLTHPSRIAVLREGPDPVIEELLRYLSIIPFLIRVALEDVELGGQVVRAGETVTVSIPAADRDPRRFPDPDTLDPYRAATGHVAFGHGVHQCLGQQLARVELRVAVPALFERFPTLRVAGQAPPREDMLIHGLHALPVTWDPKES